MRLLSAFVVTMLSILAPGFELGSVEGPPGQGRSPAPASGSDAQLPVDLLLSDEDFDEPVDNAAFYPSEDARGAPTLTGTLTVDQASMSFDEEIPQPVCDGADVELGGSCRDGSDKRLFPAITLDLFTVDDVLAAVQVGQMVGEDERVDEDSYWHVIPQYGRVWREPGDGGWARAALPLMLVHDMENHAHQGLALFLYRGNQVSDVRFQFVQQTTPWNIPAHFISWGRAAASLERGTVSDLGEKRAQVNEELAARLPVRPLGELDDTLPDDEVIGSPVPSGCVVARAVVRDGVIYKDTPETPYGPYPYPEEMRFGPRSVTKSITAPLALGRIAQAYGPYVLDLKIGDYVDGLDPEYDTVRFLDAANMATGMGGAGTLHTTENNTSDGYVDATYDDWYNGAFSNADKIEAITRDASPYPWGPGAVMRYRDRDYHLLGAALDGFVKEHIDADTGIWDYLEEEVFEPIGIYNAPIVKTREADGVVGLPWFHAGIYVTLDDLAKVFTLYQSRGSHDDSQVLHEELTGQAFSTVGAITKATDKSAETAFTGKAAVPEAAGEELYKMSFHLQPYTDPDTDEIRYLPTASGFAGNYLIMYPDGTTSLRMAKAWPAGAC